MSKFRYKSIFMYASLQFCGNIEEYFSKNTKKLVVFIVMPRVGSKFNIIRHYQEGKLIKESMVKSSTNIFLYYFYWFYYHWFILLKIFSRNEKFFLIAGHPVSFFGLSIQRFLRKVNHVYWVGDYFPGNNLVIKLFESLKKYYHKKISYTIYLSDGINKVFNNKVLDTKSRRTIMWGTKQKIFAKKKPKVKFEILFVGVVKESQGLEFIFNFLTDHKNYHLNIIGVCDKQLYRRFKRVIKNNRIGKQVFFPNKFFSDKELLEFSKKCQIGIALYNTDNLNPTFYTDPGKVKAYLEYNLPIIMSDTSAASQYVRKFKAGIIIDRDEESLSNALLLIRKNYNKYLMGVEKAIRFFSYDKYYNDRFTFLK